MISTPASRGLGAIEIQHLPDLHVQVARLKVQPVGLGELEEVVQQVLQPLAFPLHQFDLLQRAAVAGRFGVAEILGQQLHVHADRRQRVLDFVGQPARQPRDFRVLIDQPLVQFVDEGHKRDCNEQGRKHNQL